MSRYSEPLIEALIFFPLVAGLFTLPYVVYCYRKYGSVLIMRVICVYAFIYYLMSVYCLAILPFPSADSEPTQRVGINLIPFSYVPEILTKEVEFSLSDTSTWMPAFFSSGLYEPLLNILMFLPLGVFLRYYFGWSFKRTVLCAFLLSFFLEFTQYTATYGLAPYRYRLADVNDLIDNTLGGIIGYAVTPLLTFMLPTRERLNQVSYQRGARVSYVRRAFALILDSLLLFVIVMPLSLLFSGHFTLLDTVCTFAYFTLLPFYWGGKTLGKSLVRIRIVDEATHERARFGQYAARAALLHLLPDLFSLLSDIFSSSLVLFAIPSLMLLVLLIAAVSCGRRNEPQMFYEHWTHTIQIADTQSHRVKGRRSSMHPESVKDVFITEEKQMQIDLNCHVLYSKPCKAAIQQYIALHYPEDKREAVFTAVQKQYADWLKDFRTDLGGRRNFHNGVGGTYDNIMVMAYYVVCRDVTSFAEVEKLYGDLFLTAFRKLKFVNCNKKLFKKLMYKSFQAAKGRCDKWHDYEMEIEPYKEGEPIRYRFTACPVAQFAREHDLLDILPALCNVDYAAMEVIHARLVRTTTLGRGEYCDYTICGDQDPFLKEHEEYRDDLGGRWNK